MSELKGIIELEDEIKSLRKKLKAASEGFDEVAEDDNGAWMTSYADLMTLLACFFILMMAFANYDPVGFQKKTKEISTHFSGKALSKDKSETEELMEELKGHPDLSEIAKIAINDEGLILNFNSSQLFKPGETTIKKETLETLDILIDVIKSKNPNYRVVVEGHTDNIPVGSNSQFSSNWELSSSRSSKIIERFQEYGFGSSQLVSIGYGDSRPVADNQDKQGNNIKENMALNRRAVIKVLTPKKDKKAKKMGLGIYFTEQELFNK